MTIGDAIKAAMEARNADMAGKVSDALRSKGLNYNETVEFVSRVVGYDAAAEWESLMYEADVS